MSISLIIFLVLLGLAAAGWLLEIKARFNKTTWWKSILDAFFSKSVLVPLAFALVVFVAACIVPYSLQVNDRFNIAFAKENITLYQTYIEDYTAAAQKQISDYQAAQSTLAKTATSLQLQFYSQQVDAVGNKLTEQIKAFNDKILEWKIEINRATIRMKYRPMNKWVFGI